MVGKNFILQEFVDKETYDKFGEDSIQFMDPNILQLAQVLRDRFGPMTINNWHIGGKRKWSGFRHTGSSYYKRYSQHSFGRAIDVLFKDITVKEVQEYILDHKSQFTLLGLKGIETSVDGWLHIDCRNRTNMREF